jgi:hypothetical protein
MRCRTNTTPRTGTHIPTIPFGVVNWRTYEDRLRQRGRLTLWITPETLEQWNALRRTTPGGQAALLRPESALV